MKPEIALPGKMTRKAHAQRQLENRRAGDVVHGLREWTEQRYQVHEHIEERTLDDGSSKFFIVRRAWTDQIRHPHQEQSRTLRGLRTILEATEYPTLRAAKEAWGN